LFAALARRVVALNHDTVEHVGGVFDEITVIFLNIFILQYNRVVLETLPT